MIPAMSGLLLRRDYAACRCGCGQTPPLATRTYSSRGVVKGQPVLIVPGHQGRITGRLNTIRARQAVAYLADDTDRYPCGYGFCSCGCGERTNLARRTTTATQEFVGQPQRFLPGHQARVRWRRYRQDQIMRQPQGRRMCVVCYEDRPMLAFLDTSSVCVCCIARQRKVAEVDHRLLAAEVEAKKRNKLRAQRAQQASMRNGTNRRGPGITLVKKQMRMVEDVPLPGNTPL